MSRLVHWLRRPWWRTREGKGTEPQAPPGAGEGGAAPRAAGKRGAPPAPELTPMVSFGMHQIMARLDQWFALEVGRLEGEARSGAREWARAGLPRTHVEDERLPVEAALETRAAEIFREWIALVRTQIQDAIAEAARQVGVRILRYRANLAHLAHTLREVDRVEREMRRIEDDPAGQAANIGFHGFLGRKAYWVLISVLVCVDWVANVPIFGELLPREPGAEEAWANILAHSEKYGTLGGLYRAGARVLFAPDVSLLALGVIVFLVFLAHTFGESLRHRVALREEDAPLAKSGIRSHRRQFHLPAFMSAGAALLVIGVLFQAREQIKSATSERLQEATEQLTRLESTLARAQGAKDLDAIGRINRQLPEARSIVEERAKRAEYAAGIQVMNWPISVLNFVLVISAALAGYLAAGAQISEHALDPRLARLHETLSRLRGEAAEHRAALSASGEEILAWLAQAERLLHARPFGEWEGKRRRLEGVVEHFRAENARERGLDPASILAFRHPVRLDLTPPNPDEPFRAPAELLRAEAEFARLQREFVMVGGERVGEPEGEGAP